MTQPQSFKVCPQCHQPTALNAVLCATCGRRFQSTAPPINQTQVFTPGMVPPPTQPLYQPMPPAPMAAPQAGGPRDQVEWMSSCIWTWVGLFFVTTLLCFQVKAGFDTSTSETTRGIVLMVALLFGAVFTALVHRLRRLYIYFAFRRYRWWIPACILAAWAVFVVFPYSARSAGHSSSLVAHRSEFDNPSAYGHVDTINEGRYMGPPNYMRVPEGWNLQQIETMVGPPSGEGIPSTFRPEEGNTFFHWTSADERFALGIDFTPAGSAKYISVIEQTPGGNRTWRP